MVWARGLPVTREMSAWRSERTHVHTRQLCWNQPTYYIPSSQVWVSNIDWKRLCWWWVSLCDRCVLCPCSLIILQTHLKEKHIQINMNRYELPDTLIRPTYCVEWCGVCSCLSELDKVSDWTELWPRFGPVLVYLVRSWLMCGHATACLWLGSCKQDWFVQRHHSRQYVQHCLVWARSGPQQLCYLGLVLLLATISSLASIRRRT